MNFMRKLNKLKYKNEKSLPYDHYILDVLLKVFKNPYKTSKPE